jgi:energy-coupling factor transporter ATP-binding protein EcfA2
VFENFTLAFTDGLNILVGDNDSGKSTLLEAVNLALTSRVRGRLFSMELSPHHFNRKAATTYLQALAVEKPSPPPEIIIDLYLNDEDAAAPLKGTNNATLENVPGIRIRAAFWEDFAAEYKAFVAASETIKLVPVEYYRVEWLSFAGNPITPRSVPAHSSLIDAAVIRLQSGADQFLQQIIEGQLAPKERVELARAYRSLREQFSDNESIAAINVKLAETQQGLTDRELSLAIDISQKTAWESSLVPHLDELPCQFVGTGAQTMLKVMLALNKTEQSTKVVLLEEPENHQSPSSLNALVDKIAQRCAEKQVLVTTHSSFVLNRLGLDRLVLLGDNTSMRLTSLPTDTLDYFKKLSGYDTLRLVLAKRVILVEGPSDELVLQRAFYNAHGKMPLEVGVDVISTRGLSFKRFLDIARPLRKPVAVVTDNDGKDRGAVENRYLDYTKGTEITIHVGEPGAGSTLEPQLINSCGRETLNKLFNTTCLSDDDLGTYMRDNKTACALKIFESGESVVLPQYIRDAVE